MRNLNNWARSCISTDCRAATPNQFFTVTGKQQHPNRLRRVFWKNMFSRLDSSL